MTPDEARDQLALLTATLDQARAALPSHARLVAGYFSALVAEALPVDVALPLTVGFQYAYLSAVFAAGLDDPAE